METGTAQAPRAAAFFDVDGTLCATRSTTSLVWLRARQHGAWRHRLWLASLIWGAPVVWLADKLSRNLADRLVYRQFAGLSERVLRRDAQSCCRELLLPACFPPALAEIAAHKAAGRRIVLVTGGVEHVLAPFAEALGAELIAQRLLAAGDRLTGGYQGYALLAAAPGGRSQAENKAEAVRRYADQSRLDLAACYAYGDSVNDAGMLAAVGFPVAVNPDPALRRIADRSGWLIQQWARSPR
ncbi:HAD-IB family hydrolase [Phenylobacterium sp. LjRoot219]|uniref:HAD family hydrolase n=1 Tax=Phenylobacterium sp. LjRoot219 TaxID=3342283 RepID=UPI003ECD8A73